MSKTGLLPKIKAVIRAMFLMLSLVAASGAQTFSIGLVQDADGWTNVRAKASLTGPVLTKVDHNSRVLLLERAGVFRSVLVPNTGPEQQPGYFGYIHSSRIKVLKPALGIASVKDPEGWANLRSGAGNDNTVVRRLDNGTLLFLLSLDQGPWYKVETKTGERGFVHKTRIEWLHPRN